MHSGRMQQIRCAFGIYTKHRSIERALVASRHPQDKSKYMFSFEAGIACGGVIFPLVPTSEADVWSPYDKDQCSDVSLRSPGNVFCQGLRVFKCLLWGVP